MLGKGKTYNELKKYQRITPAYAGKSAAVCGAANLG